MLILSNVWYIDNQLVKRYKHDILYCVRGYNKGEYYERGKKSFKKRVDGVAVEL